MNATAPASPTFEVCIDSVAGAVAAERGGAHRVELCANLLEGGTTPSAGMIRSVLAATRLPVMVMVRPRAGHFVYDDREIETLFVEAEAVLDEGVAGIVTGALRSDGGLDIATLKRLAQLARTAQASVTFHRAFDQTSDPWMVMDQLIDLGIDRILTSGQASTADAGVELLSRLVQRAAERISIMPGCGVRTDNIRRILQTTGAQEIHFSGSQWCDCPVAFWRDEVSMSTESLPGDLRRRITSVERIRQICRAAQAVE